MRSSPTPYSSLGVPVLVVLLGALAGCKGHGDPDAAARDAWLGQHTTEREVTLRRVLNGTSETWFYDGFYPIEWNSETGAAWRWQNRRAVVRFRVRSIPRHGDFAYLAVFGWTPNEDLDVRSAHLDFFVNGERVDRFFTPPHSFEHVVSIPWRLVGNGRWLDLVIVAANAGRPRGEWRDLGFATTGFLWRDSATPSGPAPLTSAPLLLPAKSEQKERP